MLTIQLVEGREDIDWTRHAMMTSFGFIYLGSFQYLLYNKLYASSKIRTLVHTWLRCWPVHAHIHLCAGLYSGVVASQRMWGTLVWRHSKP